MENQLIVFFFLIEALVILAAAGLFVFLRRRRATPVEPVEPELRVPDELAGEARAYLSAELERTEQRLQTDVELAEAAALELRRRVLECEIQAMDLADNPDAFWERVREGYGAAEAEAAIEDTSPSTSSST